MTRPLDDPRSDLPRDISRSQVASAALEALVAEGRLKPGDRINESQLSGILGISRGPIREACRSLEEAGLLVSVPGRGTFVRTPTAEEVQHLYELRAALAGLAGRLVALRGREEAIAALTLHIDSMDSAISGDEPEDYARLNREFHEDLVAAAGNPELSQSDARIARRLWPLTQHRAGDAQNMRASNQEHRVIVAALAARDAAKAETALRKHVENGFRRFLDRR